MYKPQHTTRTTRPHENPPLPRDLCCKDGLQDSASGVRDSHNRASSPQASDHYFRIYEPAADIRLKLTLESSECSLLISTTHLFWKTHDQLNTTCFRLLIPLLVIEAIPSNIHKHKVPWALPHPVDSTSRWSSSQNFPICPLAGSFYAQYLHFSECCFHPLDWYATWGLLSYPCPCFGDMAAEAPLSPRGLLSWPTLDVQPWESHLISASLSFIICQVEMIMVVISQIAVTMK